MLDDAETAAIAALHDPVRRRLYEVVRAAGRPLSREEAAEGAGISRGLAAFHLDKLCDRGLLRFGYARPEGRSGPGAGRPAKRYRPSEKDIAVSVPERHYDVIGKLLVDTLAEPGVGGRGETAEEVALREGRMIGEGIRAGLRPRRGGADRALATAAEVLRGRGYEPYRTRDGSVRLRSCPFHKLARHAPEVVCRMNRAFIEGIVEGIEITGVGAALDPTPGGCCVVLRTAGAEDGRTN